MNKDFLQLLGDFVRIQSVSTDRAYLSSMKESVDWLNDQFEKNGFKVQIYEDPRCNPILFAHFEQSKESETILVYGHYDVQPADIADGWSSDPFNLQEKNERLYGRGVVDNKGQILIHMFSVFELIRSGNLKYNVKFLIEGNEETSNLALPELMRQYADIWKADHVIVSDGELIGDNPVIERSLRGGFNVKLVCKSANNNVHSGIYGGAVPNAAEELANFLSKIYSNDRQIQIENFYQNVDPVQSEEMENNREMSKYNGDAIRNAGFKSLLLEDGKDFYTQTGCLPSISVTGFRSGYIEEGFSNIIPAEAEVRLNFRIVTSQSSGEIKDKFEQFVKANTPNYIDYELSFHTMHEPVKINVTDPIVARINTLLVDSFGKKVLFKRVGGAIPFVSDVKNIWGKDTILVALGNDDCNMHGVDENFSIDLINKGIKFANRLYSE